jgi:uncharacterized phage-associated protein
MPAKLRFKFNAEKASQACLYILQQTGKLDFHKLFKILFFADSHHLAKYGRPISGDCYIAMRNGPVPGNFYDLLKAIKPGSLVTANTNIADYFDVHSKHHVAARVNCNVEYLSDTEQEELNQSISENKYLDFGYLTEKSHGAAWKSADLNNEMDFLAIATDAGANTEVIEYIKLNMENERLQLS